MSHRYSCVNNSCIIKEDGEFTNQSQCLQSCNRNRYRCNPFEGKCVRDSNLGEYTHLEDCNNQCKNQKFNKYTCNNISGNCVIDPDGVYLDLDECKKSCNKNNKIIWISISSFFAILFIGLLIYLLVSNKNNNSLETNLSTNNLSNINDNSQLNMQIK